MCQLGAAAKLFKSASIVTTFDIGDDGYLRRVGESFAFSQQLPVGVSFQIEMSGFDQTQVTIKAPPASQVMTSQQFQRVLGLSSLPGAI